MTRPCSRLWTQGSGSIRVRLLWQSLSELVRMSSTDVLELFPGHIASTALPPSIALRTHRPAFQHRITTIVSSACFAGITSVFRGACVLSFPHQFEFCLQESLGCGCGSAVAVLDVYEIHAALRTAARSVEFDLGMHRICDYRGRRFGNLTFGLQQSRAAYACDPGSLKQASLFHPPGVASPSPRCSIPLLGPEERAGIRTLIRANRFFAPTFFSFSNVACEEEIATHLPT